MNNSISQLRRKILKETKARATKEADLVSFVNKVEETFKRMTEEAQKLQAGVLPNDFPTKSLAENLTASLARGADDFRRNCLQ
ncbi:MAG: hypothetical protein V1851_02430 [Patescibacteria group bacterium]